MTQHTLFGSTIPANVQNSDTQQVNLATAFYITSGTTWTATGIRFYLDPTSNAPLTGYQGYLSSGDSAGALTLLSNVTFSGVTAGGWNTASFASPVALSVGTKYWVTVYFPGGCYSATAHVFGTPVQASDGSALYGAATSEVMPGNGVFSYQGPGDMSGASTFNDNWYGVDVITDDGTSGGPTIAAPTATSSATALAPTISGAATVLAPVATSSADALPPTISTGAAATVLAPVATSSATALAPSLSIPATVLAPVATSSATAPAPSVFIRTEPPHFSIFKGNVNRRWAANAVQRRWQGGLLVEVIDLGSTNEYVPLRLQVNGSPLAPTTGMTVQGAVYLNGTTPGAYGAADYIDGQYCVKFDALAAGTYRAKAKITTLDEGPVLVDCGTFQVA
jgi:hypothetical protein